MPVFHTKTIESILDPVAQQVSRLIILHEEAEDGNAMPDLSRPVQAVSKAVTNLVKVGRDTITCSDDVILKQDMPPALQRVETAARLLEDASDLLRADPFSQPARKKLIDGARGILQGTSALLLCFDESEVRKIIRECKKVLDYLAVAEVIESMEDLVQFVKDMSPCLTKVSRDVDSRQKELTHQVHRDILIRCLEQVKTLAPILICSMKIFIQIISTEGKGAEEAGENRNYLAGRMTDEINEIVRVLQLTTYDEEEFDADNLTGMKRALNAIDGKMQAAHDWLEDSLAVRGGVGEKSVRQILDYALKVADHCLPHDQETIRKLAGDVGSMTNALCELRQDGKGATPQAESLSRGINQKLHELANLVSKSVSNVEKSGVQEPAHTVAGRIEQAKRWLSNPSYDDKGLGKRAISLVIEEGKKVADGLAGAQRNEILSLCNEVESLNHQLADLCLHGEGASPHGQAIARSLAAKMLELKDKIENALVNRVVEDFIDVVGPLKQFTEVVMSPSDTPGRDQSFTEKAQALKFFSDRAVKTAKMVAAGGSQGNKKLAEALIAATNQVDSLTPQLINAGRIRMVYPESKAADEHFENLRRQYGEGLQRMRALADEATDSAKFIKQSEDQMHRHVGSCENAIQKRQPQDMVENTSSIARLANRVLMVAKQEAENSEEPAYIGDINRASDSLQGCVTPMVQAAKGVAINITDPHAQNKWREINKELLGCVSQVRKAVGDPANTQALDDMRHLSLNDCQPPYTPVSFFVDKVGECLKQTPTAGSSPTCGSSHPRSSSRLISPIPKWGRGEHSDLLYEELIPDHHHEALEAESVPPPRPPPPGGEHPPPRPPPPETDDEDDMFMHAPQPNQPIMIAAHGLHQEVRQWSSKDNDIIAAAKKMAALMARLSQLVRGEGGTKKELIACAKAIAEASDEVTRLAKELARECTDKRMRTNLLQVCERIPTIGTQLKILSTVKATMLGAQGTEEDQEATDMLVGNAQNLMQSVKETVRAAEAASIKMRTDAGIRLRWVRKQPWYQY